MMAKAQWGADPEFFGPRHAHRERRILRVVDRESTEPGPHLECAAGVGSLSRSLCATGRTVIAADRSLRSLLVLRRQSGPGVHPVVADTTALPFPDRAFASITSAETLEHIDDDTTAMSEFARTLCEGGLLSGTVPADPRQWSDWDVWADHRRRYTASEMRTKLAATGLKTTVRTWGWPLMRLYDGFFLRRVNRRRRRGTGSIEDDAGLRRVSFLGRRRWLVAAVTAALSIDRIFDGVPWGVGLIFTARKCTAVSKADTVHGASSQPDIHSG